MYPMMHQCPAEVILLSSYCECFYVSLAHVKHRGIMSVFWNLFIIHTEKVLCHLQQDYIFPLFQTVAMEPIHYQLVN